MHELVRRIGKHGKTQQQAGTHRHDHSTERDRDSQFRGARKVQRFHAYSRQQHQEKHAEAGQRDERLALTGRRQNGNWFVRALQDETEGHTGHQLADDRRKIRAFREFRKDPGYDE